MNFHDYQKKAMRTANMGLNENDQLLNAALGLSGEAGEFADLIKKFFFQGHDFNKEKLISELSDQLWYVALACQCMGIDMDDVAEYNINKLKARYPEAFTPLQSIERVQEFGNE